MTEENKNIFWGIGWDAFWYGIKSDECPNFPDQEKRDQWMFGWCAGQEADYNERFGPFSSCD